MRWARSFSIVDHMLLHGGYLGRLSHAAMGLYLFLVVVGDREGRSFYSEVRVMEILRLAEETFTAARLELVEEGLIDYRRPYWWVRTLSQGRPSAERVDPVSASAVDRETARRRLGEISRMLSGKGLGRP
jgi:hypothetical protein